MSMFDAISDGLGTVGNVLGTLPGVGNVIHAAEAVGHGAMGLYDEATGDTKGAHNELAKGALNGAEAMPFLGNILAVDDLQMGKGRDGGLSDAVQNWMFGDGSMAKPEEKKAAAPAAPAPRGPNDPTPEQQARYDKNAKEADAKEQVNRARYEKAQAEYDKKMRDNPYDRSTPAPNRKDYLGF